MLQFNITTLGCKVNQYDGAAIAATLTAAGLRQAGPGSEPQADLTVINTCCVTAAAMRKSRQAIRQAARTSPNAAVMVTGCYSDYHQHRIKALLGALGLPAHRTVVVGHHGNVQNRIRRLLQSLSVQEPSGDQRQSGLSAPDETEVPSGPGDIRARRLQALQLRTPGTEGLAGIDHFPAHQRAFVKVQDGCDAFCAYCVVPYMRPRVWSRSVDEVEAECLRLVSAGHREIVLSGVFLGAFGHDSAVRKTWHGRPSRLTELVRRIAGIDGLWRVRLSSLEAGDLDESLLSACRELPHVAPHFHLPLQSGSERILRRMNRQYTVEQYRVTVGRLRDALDRPAITTDVIVGFPSETDDDFRATLAMCRQAGFARLHAFPFSAIEGTAAWAWRDEAPPRDVVKARMAELQALAGETARAFRGQFVGRTLEALVEDRRDDGGRPQAMTERYMTLALSGNTAEPGQVIRACVDAVTDDGLLGGLAAERGRQVQSPP